jgi:N-acetylglutamate synthase/N-acetylornithine aminotransferase
VIRVGDIVVYAEGGPQSPPRASIVAALDHPEVFLGADLASGDASATAWGCDLTEDYVRVKGKFTA